MDKIIKAKVIHPKLYMVIGGKLQHVKPGTQLSLTDKQIKSLSKKVEIIDDAEIVDDVEVKKPKSKKNLKPKAEIIDDAEIVDDKDEINTEA